MRRFPLTLLAALVLSACGAEPLPEAQQSRPSARATPAAPLQGTRATRAAPADIPARPEGTEALEELLRAWHARDLPDRTVLEAHPNAEPILGWLADHGDTLTMRVRAMGLLARYPASTAHLIELARADDAHPSIRAGAVAGLGRRDLETDTTSREVVIAALADPDVRVALAAVDALRGVSAGKDALAQIAEGDGPAPLTDAARAAIFEL